MIHISKSIYKTYYFLIALAVILIPQAFVLPVEYSYENHMLENMEVIILSIGALNMLYKINKINVTILKGFYVACSLFYVIMISRELSFGRVFYPIGMDKNGEQIFMNIHQIWYGSLVYPLITILVITAIMLMLNAYKYIRKTGTICLMPKYSIRLFIIMLIFSQVIFEKNIITYLIDYGQLLEECTEILAYCSLVAFTKDITFINKEGF
mgnify:FL=1